MPKALQFGWESRRVIARKGQLMHRHTEIELSALETGAMTYQYGTQQIRLRAGDVALFWAAIPHHIIEVEPGTILHWLTLPFGAFLSWRLPQTFVETITAGKLIAIQDAALSLRALAHFGAWHSEVGAVSPDTRRLVRLEVEAFITRIALRSAAGGARASTSAPADVEADAMARVAQLIARRYTQLLTIDQIAEVVGLHPNYLMTRFRRHYGMSLLAYMTALRLAHAQRLLLLTDMPIPEIVTASGFGSTSQFYATFKRAFGLPPQRYRATNQGIAEGED
ncbi:MAG: helix-turn-helix domain-containing protein [Anaerolineae bacterium]|nr:helix-turn-helix domain-containing protein [Anaerolineae bacterium]